MGDLNELQKRLDALDIWDECMDLILVEKDNIAELNREQLLKGITSEGVNISPDYLSDPFFKGNKSASKRYAAWKQKKAHTSKSKGFLIPDMFITGSVVHNNIRLLKNGDELELTALGRAAGFDAKYKNIYGLTDENLTLVAENVLPYLQSRIKLKLGV